MNFAQKLKKMRKERNITQTELAKSINVSNGVIGDIERGARNPSKDVAVKLADFFNVDAMYWLTLEEDPKKIKYERFKQLNETIDTLIEEGYITDLNFDKDIEKLILDSAKIEIFLKLKKQNLNQD